MRKQSITSMVTVLVLAFGVTLNWGAESAGINDVASVRAAAGEKKSGNGFARALKAPFRAIGKLFGGGKDGNTPQRMDRKDVERFESAGILRMHDALNTAPPTPAADQTAEALVADGHEMLANDRISEAIALLSRATSISPESGRAHHLLAVAYFRKGLRELSTMSFDRAARLRPDDAQTLNDFGYALYRFGDSEGAVKRLRRAVKLAPANAQFWNNLALAQCRLEKYDEAYKSFARAGGEFMGRVNVANVLTRAGRLDDAIKHYEAALRVQPASDMVLRNLIGLYERTGRTDKAESARRNLAPAEKANTAQAGGG